MALSRLDRITVNPAISHGKTTIYGMPIRVQDVLELLASGMTYEEILPDDDELQHDDILAVLEFAALESAARIQPVVTKDDDFRVLHLTRQRPARLLIITCGNIANADLFALRLRGGCIHGFTDLWGR